MIVNDACSPAGSFWATFTDIAIGSADGAVRPIYNRQKSMTLSAGCGAGVSDCWQIIGHPTNVGWATFSTTTYYHGDHLGSSRQISSVDGYPVWEATYLPYGQEHVPAGGSLPLAPTGHHYKFTGKERDPESGLDYFGARYYASAQGRFLSPDWATAPTAVPYAEFGDPQTLNLYAYVGNNPITRFDVDGHCWPPSECVTAFQNAVNAATEKVISATVASGNADLAYKVTAFVGIQRDIVNGMADAFRAGEAVGACMDSCSGIQKAEALGQDLNRTSGLVTYAAGGVAAGEAVASKVGTGSLSTPTRLAQDLAVNPAPPPSLPLNRAVGPSPAQNAAAQADVQAAQASGATSIRINQQQVNAAGNRVGVNRPDLRYTNSSGQRVYTEYGRSTSTREVAHQQRIQSNDPSGIVRLKKVND